MSLPQVVIHSFSFAGKNELWQSIHILLDASIESEMQSALSKENKGEDRAWHCGRAEALRDFKDVIMQTRNAVLRDVGREEETDNPSEIGIID